MLQSGTADIAMQIDPDTAKTMTGDDVKVETCAVLQLHLRGAVAGRQGQQGEADPRGARGDLAWTRPPSILDFTLGDEGQLIAAPIPLGFPGGSGFETQPYDPAKAKELLAKAGHADGFEMEAAFPDMNVYGIDLSMLMQKVQQDLAKINIKLDLQPMPFANWRERVNGDRHPADGGVLRARLLRHLAVCRVFRYDQGSALGAAAPARSVNRQSSTPRSGISIRKRSRRAARKRPSSGIRLARK